MEIDITDHLSEVQISEIVEQELRDYLKDNLDDLVSEAVLGTVREHVSELLELNDEMKTKLRERTREVIGDISTYELFRQPVDYGHGRKGEPGIARDLLAEVVHGQRESIESRVSGIIGELDDYNIGDFISDAIRSMILDSAERR